MKIRFILNGRKTEIDAAMNRRVVDILREDLDLTGTKEGCGACTILVGKETRLACLMLAVQLDGLEITTVEGLAAADCLHPLQEAFVERGAVRCGFCIPGMLLSSVALLKKNPAPSREEIREGLSVNLCRCTGYQKIVDAVQTAAGNMSGKETP